MGGDYGSAYAEGKCVIGNLLWTYVRPPRGERRRSDTTLILCNPWLIDMHRSMSRMRVMTISDGPCTVIAPSAMHRDNDSRCAITVLTRSGSEQCTMIEASTSDS